MLLPERTVDIWTACAVQRLLPMARTWAPTTNAQAGPEPYDLSVDGPSKLLLLEHKGVTDSNEIAVNLLQLVRLRRQQSRAAKLGGQFLFYGLPQVAASGYGYRGSAVQFTFQNHLLLLSSSELIAEIRAQRIPRRPRGALTSSSRPYFRLDAVFLSRVKRGRTPGDAIRGALACELGLRIENAEELFTALDTIDRVGNRPLGLPDVKLVLDELQPAEGGRLPEAEGSLRRRARRREPTEAETLLGLMPRTFVPPLFMNLPLDGRSSGALPLLG